MTPSESVDSQVLNYEWEVHQGVALYREGPAKDAADLRRELNAVQRSGREIFAVFPFDNGIHIVSRRIIAND